MPLWSPAASVKVSLRRPTGAEGSGVQETRRVALPAGPRTQLAELLELLEERFGAPLARAVAYADAEGDVLTVTTDAELREALASGTERFEVTVAKDAPDQEDEWELVEGAKPQQPVASGPINVCWATEIRFWVNGEETVVCNPSPSVTLLDWLRESKGHTDVHVGCGEGGCGICTVNLTRKDPSTGKLRQVPVNSCLRKLCALDGCHVITTSGIGCQKDGFHSLQSAVAKGNGSQCGFCTPGWVMNMYSLLERNQTPSREDVERNFDGNLCRCTGYRPILTSFGAFAKGGEHCGKHTSVPHPAGVLAHSARPLHFKDTRTGEEWYRPVSMEQFAEVARLAVGRKLRPLCASTADGVAKYLMKPDASNDGTVFVDISYLSELQGVRLGPDGLECGATTTLEEVIDNLEKVAKDVPSFGVLAEHVRRIASVQIRSVASWAGNLMLTREYPSFASDLATILAGVGATFEVQLAVGARAQRLSLPELMATKGDILLLSMRIPKAPAGSIFQTFKAAPRSAFSHAYVNFAAYVALDAASHTVSESRIFLGGTCKTLLQASKTEATLHGQPLSQSTLKIALASLKAEIAANVSVDERSSSEYREHLAAGFLYKTFLAATGASVTIPERYASALDPFVQMVARPISSGTETFATKPSEAPISQYVPKRSAMIQASGEAAYPSDFGGRGALFGQLVFSTAARAKLVALDPSEALKMPGVHDFVTASAIPGQNCTNPVAGGEGLKEKVFFEVNDVVPCVGAVLGLVVAESWRGAREAAKRVIQRYTDVGPVVGTIDEAVQLRRTIPGGADAGTPTRFRGARPELAKGVESCAAADAGGDLMTAKGTFKTGGQRHFYMETQSVCVIPHDGNQWEVICSDQDANLTQGCLAAVLGVPMHQINVKVPRAGGGFGGKLTRQLLGACAAAVAAGKLRCPVRIQNERSDDMQLVGGRQPLDFDYEVAFDSTGRVDSMRLAMMIDSGWLYSDTKGCLSMAVGWVDNCYQYRSFKVTTQAAITDTPSNTAMRAPGCMQSVLAAEVVMEHVAKMVGKPVEEIQALNFYRVNESPTTPFGDHIGKNGFNWTIPILWSQIQEQAQFAKRQEAVKAYNAANRWRKRGIAISPAKYVMDDSTANYSSGALVCIYPDGTVLVSSGGSEVGQGLTTKIALCVADALGAPFEKVQVGPRETSKVPDNTLTGGSGTSECSAQAAMLACQKLLPLLEKYRAGGKKWEDAVSAACHDQVGLMASAWYALDDNRGNTNTYATYGTAISEVEIDVLTGEVRVDRVDVLMDLGTQLDAAVDIGQIQGGFVIALGYLLTEELKVDSTGTQLHLGTWDYKIPGAYDIPVEFNVQLLKDSPNPVGVKGSKASAEPSMCLLPSVYLAVKNAIYAARGEVGLADTWFMLNTPLTPEAIRIAVGVPETQMDVPP